MNFDAFLARLLERPLPVTQIGRIRTFAREFAEGVLEGFWKRYIMYDYVHLPRTVEEVIREMPDFFVEKTVNDYVQQRWSGVIPELDLVAMYGYIDPKETGFYVEKPAFDLLNEAPSSTIFISYRRRTSSALALLVLSRLKEYGLDGFVDMTIQPGDNWHAHLQEQIEKRDFFVALLADGTLDSEVVQKEILWAIKSGKVLIPIWQPGYVYQSGKHNVPPDLDRALSNTHTIRVLEESAAAYNTAMVELLNRFGVTP
jgi:hypothetical protein